MCGIVAGLGKINYPDFFLQSLKILEYRGYDSCGIGYNVDGNTLVSFKTVGTVEQLTNKIDRSIKPVSAIAHTRWATHGKISFQNAHPQTSMHENVMLVHNGVIDNADALRNELKKQGYTFNSETDTEVIADVIETLLGSNEPLDALNLLKEKLVGTYALAILVKGYEGIFFTNNGMSLYAAKSKDSYFLTSDLAIFAKGKDVENIQYFSVKDLTFGYMSEKGIELYGEVTGKITLLKPSYKSLTNVEFLLSQKNDEYTTYFRKEIAEETSVLQKLFENYVDPKGKIKIAKSLQKAIKKATELVFVGCGTSYHASLIGDYYFEQAGLPSTSIVASEFLTMPRVFSKRPLFILISQSGETADVRRVDEYLEQKGFKRVLITNNPYSSLGERADYCLPILSGKEMSVAASKTYMAQVFLLYILSFVRLGKPFNRLKFGDLTGSLQEIEDDEKTIKALAMKLAPYNGIFLVGKGLGYLSALECSLKMKEVCYLSVPVYPSGEFKHGPIALIEKGTMVISCSIDAKEDLLLQSNVTELESRGAKTLNFSFPDCKTRESVIFLPPVSLEFRPLLMVKVFQLLTYHLALLKGVDIDKPRNLAKAVTVQ